jgi:predicted kinase
MPLVVPDLHLVVTGLPASGKSTVGRLLHRELALPLLDKDTILESLFDALGCPDRAERARLSRASDEVLLALAATTRSAVLVNWWREDVARRLVRLGAPLVEVFCDCPFETAAARFEARERHPGHLDRARTPDEIEAAASRLRATWGGPLDLGPLVRIDTSGTLDAVDAMARVREACSVVPRQ